MLDFPFARIEATVNVLTADHRAWWQDQRKTRLPIPVVAEGTLVKVYDSAYRLTPRDKGYACSRPNGHITLGEVHEYGVRLALTTTFFHELSAVRAAIYGKSCPSPLCYEMPNGDLVHPGPCFTAHPSSIIKRTRYNLTGDADALCSVCQERFV